MEINGKTILITGGLGSLGGGIADALKKCGANVVIFDQDDDPKRNAFKVDVTKETEIEDALQKIERVDVLINCAGEIYSEPFINVMKKERHAKNSWDRVLNNNLNSCFLMSSQAAQKMAASRTRGVIINFSSISAQGNMGQAAYAAAKAGIEALTKVMAKELGMFKIRTCAIAPGFIETPSTKAALSDSLIDHWKKQTPLRTLGQMEDIVSTVKYIIETDYLSGAVIHIDGGLTI